jgi:hypothetical protein
VAVGREKTMMMLAFDGILVLAAHQLENFLWLKAVAAAVLDCQGFV